MTGRQTDRRKLYTLIHSLIAYIHSSFIACIEKKRSGEENNVVVDK